MSLRARLASFAAGAVIVAVAAAAILAWFLARNSMLAEIDDRLRDQARLTARVVEQAEQGIRPAPSLLSAIQPVPVGIQLVAADGTTRSPVIGAGINLPPDSALESVLAGRADGVTTTAVIHNTRWRVVTMALGGGGAIRVARSMDEFEAAQRQLGVQLGLLAATGGLVAGGLGYVVARAGLKPVGELTSAAERVARTKDLAARITTTGGDEIARLGDAVNHMLEALDDARTRQRHLVEDVGHELRTPLTSLRANIDVLVASEDHGTRIPVHERRAIVHELRTVCEELSALVSEVVQLARGDQLGEDVVEVDVDALVAHAIHLARMAAPHVAVRVAGQSGALVIAQAMALQRAVANLVRNAVQLSPAGEEVVVSVGSQRGWLEFSVADRGPGVDDTDKSRVFDRFYRGTARVPVGTGLGLAIARQTAEAHGGGVGVKDRPGGGAVFTLWIPLDATGLKLAPLPRTDLSGATPDEGARDT